MVLAHSHESQGGRPAAGRAGKYAGRLHKKLSELRSLPRLSAETRSGAERNSPSALIWCVVAARVEAFVSQRPSARVPIFDRPKMAMPFYNATPLSFQMPVIAAPNQPLRSPTPLGDSFFGSRSATSFGFGGGPLSPTQSKREAILQSRQMERAHYASPEPPRVRSFTAM